MTSIKFVLEQIDDLRLDENTNADGVYILDKLRKRITDKPAPDRYYRIISRWSDEPIGKCHYTVIGDVKQEESRATFNEISKEEFEREDE